jgi:type I restriction enzyme R subunit
MMNVVLGTRDEDTLTSLASRLTRLERQITPQEKEKTKEITGGKTINKITADLLEAFDPDKIIQKAKTIHSAKEDEEIPEEILKKANEELAKEASSVFDDAKFRDYIENVRKKHEQIIDTLNLDVITGAGWSKQVKEKAEETIKSFKEFLQANKDEIIAIEIFYSQPYRRRELTFKMIKELCDVLKTTKPAIAPLPVWRAYELIENVNGTQPKDELTALVALVRHALDIDPELINYEQTVNKNFQTWVFKKQAGALKFTKEQMDWLRMIKDHIASSVHVERDDFDNTPFAELGGLAKAHMLFGNELDEIINELNEALAA